MKRSFIREILESINEKTISFAGGLPNELLFPHEDLKIATLKVMENPKVYQYTISNGIDELREQIALRYTKEGFTTKKENILITTGSQQAMYILAKFFEKKDITIEEPSYLGAMNIFRLNGLKIDGAKLQNSGVDINEFEKSFKNTKLAYLIPDFQNPSATTYSQEKRDAVANIIRKYSGILIEDSPYSELFFDKKMPYISKDLPNNSFLLGSFSKTLVPSYRIGWIRADEKLIQSILIIKESIDLHSSGFVQFILSNYLKNDTRYEKHLQIIRDDYKLKAEFFSKTLKSIMPEFKHETPKGGMFLYGGFEDKKINTFDLVYKCLEKNVVFVPANQFYIDKVPNSEIRFNYTHSNLKEIEEGIKIIKSCL